MKLPSKSKEFKEKIGTPVLPRQQPFPIYTSLRMYAAEGLGAPLPVLLTLKHPTNPPFASLLLQQSLPELCP